MSLATVDLPGVEILAADVTIHGRGSPPGGDRYSVGELRAIADAHRELASELRPPATIGHDGYGPSVGRLENLRVVGSKLVADVKDVPRRFAELIDSKAYSSRSVELSRVTSQHGFGLLTATHCRKLAAGRTTITLDDLFGSSLFTRDPEIVLGIQRHGNITKLHDFKSREPGLELGDVAELLFSRERGYWPKPTVDPDEREAELERVGTAVREWIEQHPGESTIAVKTAVGAALKVGKDKVKQALDAQVRSGAVPEPLRSGRGAMLWYPLSHAALTCPDTLLGQVEAGDASGQSGDDLTGAAQLYVVQGQSSVGQVDEAEIERLEREHADSAETKPPPSVAPVDADETATPRKPRARQGQP